MSKVCNITSCLKKKSVNVVKYLGKQTENDFPKEYFSIITRNTIWVAKTEIIKRMWHDFKSQFSAIHTVFSSSVSFSLLESVR